MNTHPTGRGSPRSRAIIRQVRNALERFIHVEALSGIILFCAGAAALVWANSPASDTYERLWHTPFSVGFGDLVLAQPLHFVVKDVLMTVFFLVVGMEIRREFHGGILGNFRAAVLPIAAAAGGVAVPALIYLGLSGGSDVRSGWAIPTPTDIAFAIGALALLGRMAPKSVRVLLLAVAVVDDIAAILIVAVFYSGGFDYVGIVIALVAIALVRGLQWIGVSSAYGYLVPGAILWLGLLKSGVHPTLAGVVLGLMTPVRGKNGRPAPVETVQAALHPWVAYGVMPLFALANAGVTLSDIDITAPASGLVFLGVVAGLVIGKPVGIVLAGWISVRSGWGRLPHGVEWRHLWLVGCFGGIGFTMSIFIASLAFPEAEWLGAAKLGVLAASTLAALIGLILGRAFAPR